MQLVRVLDNPASLKAVDLFTSKPENKIPLNFRELHQSLKFINQQKKEADEARQKIIELTKKAVEATKAGLLQDAMNWRNKITELMPVAYASNLAI